MDNEKGGGRCSQPIMPTGDSNRGGVFIYQGVRVRVRVIDVPKREDRVYRGELG